MFDKIKNLTGSMITTKWVESGSRAKSACCSFIVEDVVATLLQIVVVKTYLASR